jgi:two-component system chemotaxis response regulator CheB
VTFRSAANTYGDRVVGVVLSGQLDDGTAGLWEIKRRGGITVVQNPEEAAFPSMPLSALREIEIDHTVRVADMGALLTRLTVGDTTLEARAASMGRTEMEPKVGHSYSPRSMFAEHLAAQEKALWAAAVALEEGSTLALKLADMLDVGMRERLMEESRVRLEEAAMVKRILEGRKSFSLD